MAVLEKKTFSDRRLKIKQITLRLDLSKTTGVADSTSVVAFCIFYILQAPGGSWNHMANENEFGGARTTLEGLPSDCLSVRGKTLLLVSTGMMKVTKITYPAKTKG